MQYSVNLTAAVTLQNGALFFGWNHAPHDTPQRKPVSRKAVLMYPHNGIGRPYFMRPVPPRRATDEERAKARAHRQAIIEASRAIARRRCCCG